MGANFEVYADNAGASRWRLVGGNGEKMAASEPYVTPANAERGIRDAQVAVLHTLEAELAGALERLQRTATSMSSEDAAKYVIDLIAIAGGG